MSNYTKQQVEDARNELLELLNEGDTVWFIIHSVARSGMSRTMSFHIPIVGRNGKLFIKDITWLVAQVLDYNLIRKSNWTVRVNGCGMDMCFYVAYCLGLTLFGQDKGYALDYSLIS